MTYRSNWWGQPKYKNKKVTTTDGKFDSQHEYYRWCELLTLARLKEITDLKRQVKYVLIDKSKHGREISYIADFTYIQDGKLIGAVTHVLINDPTTGYGIFIENMLNAANVPMARAS